jgi:hypothetical protein
VHNVLFARIIKAISISLFPHQEIDALSTTFEFELCVLSFKTKEKRKNFQQSLSASPVNPRVSRSQKYGYAIVSVMHQAGSVHFARDGDGLLFFVDVRHWTRYSVRIVLDTRTVTTSMFECCMHSRSFVSAYSLVLISTGTHGWFSDIPVMQPPLLLSLQL